MVRLSRWMAALAAGVAVLLLMPGAVAGQRLYPPDAPRDPGAKSWAFERAKLPPFNPPRTADGQPDLQDAWLSKMWK